MLLICCRPWKRSLCYRWTSLEVSINIKAVKATCVLYFKCHIWGKWVLYWLHGLPQTPFETKHNSDSFNGTFISLCYHFDDPFSRNSTILFEFIWIYKSSLMTDFYAAMKTGRKVSNHFEKLDVWEILVVASKLAQS